MKHLVLAAAVLTLGSPAARAAEGSGDPFAQHWTGTIGTHQLAAPAPRPMQRSVPPYAQLLPSEASMAVVQTANSLPVRLR